MPEDEAYCATPSPNDQSIGSFSITETNTLRGSVPAYSWASSAIRRYSACFCAGVRPERIVMATYTMPSSRCTPR